MSRRMLGSRGDTIVEVLIAISVSGAMLMAAFGLVHHTTQNIQDTKEHAEALRLLQGQLEKLRAAASANAAVLTTDELFCFNDNGDLVKFSTKNPPPLLTSVANPMDLSVYPDTAGGDDCLGGQARLYHFAIEPDLANTHSFKAVVVWDRVSGGQAREELAYKVY